MSHGCKDCKYCRYYPSHSYYDPDEYECVGFDRDFETDLSDEELDDIMTRAWENGEEWEDEPLCPAYEMYIEPPWADEVPDYVLKNRREIREEQDND